MGVMTLPYEIELMEQIAEHLKIWFQEDPGDKNYPSGTVDLRLRNGISLAVELVSFDEALTWLWVNDQKEVARSLEQERDRFLSHLQVVEQAIERGDNPPLELIELRSKITRLIGTLEQTAKVFRDNLTRKKPAGTGQKEIVEVKPGAFGITVNIKEIAKRIWKCVCSRSKD